MARDLRSTISTEGECESGPLTVKFCCEEEVFGVFSAETGLPEMQLAADVHISVSSKPSAKPHVLFNMSHIADIYDVASSTGEIGIPAATCEKNRARGNSMLVNGAGLANVGGGGGV